MEKIRIIVVIFLVLVIACTSVYIYINKDSLFRREVTIKYYTGCEETYVNEILITDKCIIPEKNKVNTQWMLNLSNVSLLVT